MPISTTNRYIPTMQEFVTHWSNVNVALGASPLLLKGGYSLSSLTTERAEIQNLITTVESVNNNRQIAAANRDAKKSAITGRIGQFRAAVKYQVNGSAYVAALPVVPDIKRAEGIFLRPLDDMATLWFRVNNDENISGFAPPLTLLGGYDLVAFAAELDQLRDAYSAVSAADIEAKLARKRRDALLPTARTRMLQYRTAVLAKFGPDDPFTLSLPKYSPDRGSTPEPVNLSGVWDAASGKANLLWSASDNANLDHYDIRQSGAGTYKAADESSVASVPKTQTAYATNAGLTAPGAVNTFKVYVITADGNERGSNAVTISHPM